MRDRRAEDGALCSGYRRVRKDGVIRFAKDCWQDAKLLPFVGEIVFVMFNNYWCTNISIYQLNPRKCIVSRLVPKEPS